MKKKAILLGVLLVAVVVTAFSVSGTYAKYTTSEQFTDQARVAKWNIAIGKTDITANLFQEVYNTFGGSYVKSSDTNPFVNDNVIAPGTRGSYTFEFSGETETNYTISAKLVENPDGNPFITNYSYNNVVLKNEDGNVTYNPLRFRISHGTTAGNWVTYDKINEELAKAVDSTKVYAAGTLPEETFKIEWTWAFDLNQANFLGITDFMTIDSQDTLLGNRGTDDIKIVLEVSATQSTLAATN